MKNNLEADFLIESIKLSLTGQAKECHTNAKRIFEILKEKGYPVILVKGIYFNPPDKIIKHSWIECEDKILETDCQQLRVDFDIMPNVACAILDKNKFAHRYRKETT